MKERYEGPPPPTEEEYRTYDEQQVALRDEYLQTALALSDDNDGVVLLNPRTVSDDGEWEAWFFASWIPGAYRYRSFWDLMQGEYESFETQLKYARGEPRPYAASSLGLRANRPRRVARRARQPAAEQRCCTGARQSTRQTRV